MTPNDLLLAARGGDAAAFVELRRNMTRPVRLIVQGYLDDPARVDAVTAAVFEEAWQTAETYDPEVSTANQWILALARRRAAQRPRRTRRAPTDLVVRSIRRDGDLRERGSAAPSEDDRLIWAVGTLGAGDTVVGRHAPALRPEELPGVEAPDRLRDVMADRLHRLRITMARLVA